MSDGPDLLERTRMALAEVGVDPMLVRWHPTAGGELLNVSGYRADFAVLWRAEQLAKHHDADRVIHCLACALRSSRDYRPDAVVFADCLAYLPLTEDCGIDR